MGRCTAKAKQTGVRCKRHAAKGRRVCAIHGGKSLAGVDSPTFEHGRYSKYLPDQIVPKYRDALADKELIRLDDEIAVIDARLKSEMESLKITGMNERGWGRAQDLYRSLRRATVSGNTKLAAKSLNDLGTVLLVTATDSIAWDDIVNLIDQRRKLVETERKRLQDEDNAIGIEKLMLMIAAIIDIIRRHVASKETRGAISEDIRRLVDGPHGAG